MCPNFRVETTIQPSTRISAIRSHPLVAPSIRWCRAGPHTRVLAEQSRTPWTSILLRPIQVHLLGSAISQPSEMRANENTIIIDSDVILVPYKAEHVARYHEWMTSPELRELTASEPLTLEEEYAMQNKWQTDEDSLTFIILAAPASGPALAWTPDLLRDLPMIGDVNLFLKGSPLDEDFEAEVEIMIAEPEFGTGLSNRGAATDAVYASSPRSPHPLPVSRERFVVRIGEKNAPSIRLFEKLGFAITKRVAVFEEVELRFVARSFFVMPCE
ncbi:N-acetyltransferase 9 [Grifola frondosa]|uniref:N-acetyltransferase 9 n=1 Tax=Grifola frondosa TaxID=5627 RepID=A0A1C7MS39_GRIFR|nr:N-acetyltransferase 9 [Grifola frondosa]